MAVVVIVDVVVVVCVVKDVIVEACGEGSSRCSM